MEFIEGAKTDDDYWVVSMAVVRCLVPFLANRTYGKGQVGVESLDSGGGLALDDIAHLLRPPGWVIECCCQKDTTRPRFR